jgi:hypothetical protein
MLFDLTNQPTRISAKGLLFYAEIDFRINGKLPLMRKKAD